MRYYRKGFWMEPGVKYQCAKCAVKFGTSYPKFVSICPSCGAEFLAYVEEDESKAILCWANQDEIDPIRCQECKFWRNRSCPYIGKPE
jgi:predicted  nucleic acid-binding Zn-ribbon protein